MAHSVLLVEDDPALIELVRYNLEASNFFVTVANDGEDGLLALKEKEFDLVILDWMLPSLSGITILREIRRMRDKKATPILMLTARGEESDKVYGLEAGADDYVVKPFSPAELIARINGLLRRSSTVQDGGVLIYDDLELSVLTHKVRRSGRAIHLGPTEFKLLRTLMERPERVFSREQLLDKAWGHGIYVEDRTVDVHILRLRRALNADGKPDLIRTVRAEGYALDIDKK